MCFVDIENAFNRDPRQMMEWAMRKKGLPEVIVRALMNLYHAAKTKVRIGFELSEEFLVQVGVHQESVLSPLLFAKEVNLISENAREGLINEILYANDLVLMSESIENQPGLPASPGRNSSPVMFGFSISVQPAAKASPIRLLCE